MASIMANTASPPLNFSEKHNRSTSADSENMFASSQAKNQHNITATHNSDPTNTKTLDRQISTVGPLPSEMQGLTGDFDLLDFGGLEMPTTPVSFDDALSTVGGSNPGTPSTKRNKKSSHRRSFSENLPRIFSPSRPTTPGRTSIPTLSPANSSLNKKGKVVPLGLPLSSALSAPFSFNNPLGTSITPQATSGKNNKKSHRRSKSQDPFSANKKFFEISDGGKENLPLSLGTRNTPQAASKKKDKKSHRRSKSENTQMIDIAVVGRLLKLQTKVGGKSSLPQASSPVSDENSDPNANITNDDIILRSCEMEPSMHQVELPSRESVLVYARICALAESYRLVDKKFDFSNMIDMSRFALEGFCSKLPSAAASSQTIPMGTNNHVWAGAWALLESHRPIVNSMLECADDLVLNGFVHEGSEEQDRVEVAIFSSETLRQVIISYRGSTDRQKKPVKNSAKQKEEGGGISTLHADHPVPVNPCFRDTYFAKNMEERVFTIVDKLLSDRPFFDVVTTGHSFGAALATIGALRYAARNQMFRVSCIAFASPRIGGAAFRDLAHSLPNLKAIRVELCDDPWVIMPEGPKWTHAGHSIVMNLSSSYGAVTEKDSLKSSVSAYRFDKKRASGGSTWSNIPKWCDNKTDHGIMGYVNAITTFTCLGLPWVSDFVGEEGDGISGDNFERRLVV